MSDIAPVRASVAVATATAIATGATSATPPLATGPGNAIPAAIVQLGTGAVVSGTVIDRSARGQVTIRTDNGTLTLQTPVALRVGSTVTLQIQSLGAQSQFMILSVDGQPLAGQAVATPIVAGNPALIGGAGNAVPGSMAQTAGGNSVKPLPATDASGRPITTQTPKTAAYTTTSSAASTATSPTTAPSAPLTLRPGVVLTGLLTAPPVLGTAQTTALPTAQTAPSAPLSPMQPPAHATFAVGDSIAVRVLGLAQPPARTAISMGLPEAPMPRVAAEVSAAEDAVTFTATVIAPAAKGAVNEPIGATLLRTPFGLISLPVPAHEPPGSQILLELLPPLDGAPRLDHVNQELGTASRRLSALTQDWPALRDVAAALEDAAPDIAPQTLATSIPRVGPTLAAGMLFFIAAMRSGSGLRGWIGDQAVDSLERAGHGALLGRLADDVANLPRLAETQPNGWQTLLLPIFDGDKLCQIRMSMRRSRKDENGERKDGARFIIEAELSRLGPFQLDGLVRLPQFDLAVRTRDNLPPDLRANIIEIFNDALQATRLTGTVVFQIARDSRPGPFEDWQASGLGLTV